MNIWASQMGLLKLLRSLEGGTRVQQIIIGYFVAPISVIIKMIFYQPKIVSRMAEDRFWYVRHYGVDGGIYSSLIS